MCVCVCVTLSLAVDGVKMRFDGIDNNEREKKKMNCIHFLLSLEIFLKNNARGVPIRVPCVNAFFTRTIFFLFLKCVRSKGTRENQICVCRMSVIVCS